MKKKSGIARKIIVAYVPVLHEGYRRFFESHKDAAALYILGKDISDNYVPLKKDIRALPPELIRESVKAWGIFDVIEIIDELTFKNILTMATVVVMPDEDVMRELKEKHFGADGANGGADIVFDSIFLRWDKHKSSEGRPIEADQTVSKDEFDIKMADALDREAGKSSDWWRQVGALVVKDGKVVFKAHNHHVPSEHMPYVDGDPRSDFHKGVNLELSTAIHAEASIIAQAAEKGTSLKSASMYVSTFPCPPCAKLIAYSGISKLYYAGGYGVLDGERVLKSRGVEIIFIDRAK